MLRTTFIRRVTAVRKSIQEPLKRNKLDTLATVSFSPMNPGVTVFRTAARHAESTQESFKCSDVDMLAMTSFSPMNPGVTICRPFPGDPESPQDTPKTTPNIEALIAASTSCSPTNPGATLPLMSALIPMDMDVGGHAPGSRSRVLEDIPSILKRFNVPDANVLTRFPPKNQEYDEYHQALVPKPETKTVLKTEPTTAIIPVPRPWYFKLPTFLRPREGTTYYTAFSSEEETEAKLAGKPNIVQYILYGNPDPDGKVAPTAVVQKRTFWQAVFCRVPEEEEAVQVATAKMVTDVVAKVEGKIVELGEGEVHKAVAVKQVEKNKTADVQEGGGYGVMAK